MNAIKLPQIEMKQDQTTGKPADALETIENVELEDQKHVAVGKTDYAGAALKSDPEEIKLVRKLDLGIMVSLIAPEKIAALTLGSRCSV